jgi:hypothetical protein
LDAAVELELCPDELELLEDELELEVTEAAVELELDELSTSSPVSRLNRLRLPASAMQTSCHERCFFICRSGFIIPLISALVESGPRMTSQLVLPCRLARRNLSLFFIASSSFLGCEGARLAEGPSG